MLARDLLLQSSKKLEQAGCDAPRLDAELLLMHAWGCSRTDIFTRSQVQVPADIVSRYSALLKRRQRREPLAHITGEKEFWSRRFIVGPDVLVPRPETEHLIEAMLGSFPDRNQALHFCDIGTGSGCIAITLACEYPHAHITATDISSAALEIAKKNATLHKVLDRIEFILGDMLTPLGGIQFDALISNPPYVALAEMDELDKELGFEPRHALTDESDGLQFLQCLADNAPAFLNGGGLLVVETGPCGLPVPAASLKLQQKIYDLAGHLRAAVYQRMAEIDSD